MIWPLIREYVPYLRTVASTSYNRNTRPTTLQQGRRLRKASKDLDTPASLARSGSLKASISALTNYTRPSRKPSQESLEDDMYDLEMGIKPTDFVTKDNGVGLGITSSIRKTGSQEKTDSKERILGTLGVQRTVMETQQPGGISVERTIVVHEEMMHSAGAAEVRNAVKSGRDEDDGQTRLYDWDRRDAPSRASFDTEVKA